MKLEVRRHVKCDVCGSVDEGVEIEIGFSIFKIRRSICEGCISKVFRKFKKRR